MTGAEISELLLQTVFELPDFSRSANDDDRKRATELLKLFYVLCLHGKASEKTAGEFERVVNGETDFRLEASFLERMNDFFYEDEEIRTVPPDWIATTKDLLTLPFPSGLIPFRDSPHPEKTATLLLKALTAMFFRDGMLILPAPACLRSDDRGNVYFVRARMPVVLNERERMAAVSFAKAMAAQDFAAAARALSLSGRAAGSGKETAGMLEKFAKESAPLSFCGKVRLFLRFFPDLPLFFRHAAFVTQVTEKLCRPAFDEEKFGQTFLSLVSAALPEETKHRYAPCDDEALFRQTFSLSAHHMEQLSLQNKKVPAFLSDSGKIMEILSEQTVLKQFRVKKFRFRPYYLPLAIIIAMAAFLLF